MNSQHAEKSPPSSIAAPQSTPPVLPHEPDSRSFSAWLDFASKFVPIVAIILGGLWTIKLYHDDRASNWSIDLGVDTEVVDLPGNDTEALLIIKVSLKNTGKVPVTSSIIDPHKGLALTVYEHGARLDKEKTEASEHLIEWSAGDSLVGRFNMLSRYPETESKTAYMLNPGDVRHEAEAIVVGRERLYGASVRFWATNPDDSSNETLRSSGSCNFTFVPSIGSATR